MGSDIKRFSGTVTLQAVAEQADATAGVVNAFLSLEIQPGDDWGVIISDANVVITYPESLDGATDNGGAGGSALGPVQFLGTNGGEPWYFLVNANTGKSTPYSGYTLVNGS